MTSLSGAVPRLVLADLPGNAAQAGAGEIWVPFGTTTCAAHGVEVEVAVEPGICEL